jgi:uncharacterized membrane-anchored protein
MDWQTISVLSLFRGVIGLAVGVALGNAIREFSSHKIILGALGLGQAMVYAALVALMHLSILQYDEHPFIYWGVFVLAALVGTLKTNGVLKTIGAALYLVFGGIFFLFGAALVVSGVRSDFNIPNLIVGGVLMLVGIGVTTAWAIPFVKNNLASGS